MSTLLVDTTSRTHETATGDADVYDRVLPAIEEYIGRLTLRCHHSTESNTWSVTNDHGQLVTVTPRFNLTLGYELRWGEPVTTIAAHVIPCFMRHVLRRRTQLLETFAFNIENPEFHRDRTGASGSLSLTKK